MNYKLQKSEIRNLEIRNQKSEIRNQKSEIQKARNNKEQRIQRIEKVKVA
jgi:hypothetical protein